jgi:L-serine deaminase
MGTVIDEELIFKAKQKALSGNMPLSRVLEDALKMYLVAVNKKTAKGNRNIVQETKGAMKVSNKKLKAVMEEDGLYES